MKRLPCGIQNFESLIDDGYLYVDKTAEEALDQIRHKEYVLPWSLDGRKLIGIGLNFNTEQRRPDDWLIEDLPTQKRKNATQKNFTTQKKLTSTQKKVMDYLKKHPEASLTEVSEALGNVSVDGVKYSVKILKKRCGLRRENGRKNGNWVFKK